jgi:gliding motility-associated-like protein/uncharacterized repeat protein (TIGR01451 family)
LFLFLILVGSLLSAREPLVESKALSATLSGTVYHDLNRDGSLNNGESGVGQVWVKLISGNTVVSVLDPDPVSGIYSFINIPDGDYSIIIDDNNDTQDITPNSPINWIFQFPSNGSLPVSVSGTPVNNLNLGMSFNLSTSCMCGYGDGLLTQVPITIDGDVLDWSLPLSDLDNNACDAADDTDRDAPVQSTGRNLVRNSITYDNVNLYMFTQRTGQPNNTQNFIYYADINLDGLMQTGEPVVVARWQGSNTRVFLELHAYQAVDPAGDPMLDSDGFGDGYTLPGVLSFVRDLQEGAGDQSGTQMEWAASWSDLGVPSGAAIGWHTSSTNSNPGGASLPSQIDDNIAGCGGRCSGSNQFANVQVIAQNILIQDTTFLSEKITNTGNGNDLFDLGSQSSGDYIPQLVGIYADFGRVGVYDHGVDQMLTDTDGDGIVDTGVMSAGQSLDILVAITIPSGLTNGCADLEITATSNFLPGCGGTLVPAEGSGTFSICIEADLSLTKSLPVNNLTVGDKALFTIMVENSGPSEATNVVVADLLPSGYQYVSDDASGNYNSTTGIWQIDQIAPRSSVSLNILTMVLGSGSYENTAEVINSDQDDPDSTPGNNDPSEDDQDTVTPTVNSRPTADDDLAVTDEDVAVPIDILDGDNDLDGTLVVTSITIVSVPSNGSLSIDPITGVVTYTPNPDFNGFDAFQYTVEDNQQATSNTATVEITVNSINDTPTASDNNFATSEDSPVGGDLLSTALDPDGNNLIINTVPVIGPSNGNLVINPDGTFIYTPDSNFTGTDSFTFEICDDGTPSECTQATITIDISAENDPPVALDDVYTTNEDQDLIGDLSTNDSDPVEGDNLVYQPTPLSNPLNGTVVINPDGSFTYTPEPNFFGSDSFIYRVCDDGITSMCATATANITVDPINDPPQAQDDLASGDPGTPIVIDALLNDLDIDEDNLAVSSIISGPTNGSAIILPDGTIQYTSDPAFFGTDNITYEVCDDGVPSACDQGIITLIVPYTPLPPEPADDQFETDEDNTASGNLLSNDRDPNVGEGLIINTTPVSGPTNGSVTINPDGSFTYIPNSNFNGVDSFTYEVCDDVVPQQCTIAAVTISVNPVNDPPTALDDDYVTSEENAISGNVVDNDIDLDGDALDVSIVPISGPVNGSLILNSNGTFTYTPDEDFNGIDSFVYQVCDNGSPILCVTATATITVDPVNDSPVTVDQEISTNEDTVLAGDLLNTVTDPEGDNLVVNSTPLNGPDNGTVIINADGTFEYTPDTDFYGTDSFTVEVCDNGTPQACSQITITITVLPVNDNPMGVDDNYTTDEDIPIRIDAPGVLVNDSDVDLDPLFVLSSDNTSVNGGIINMESNGTFSYSPPAGFSGVDTFTYIVSDANGGSAEVTVTITVNNVNVPPLVGSINKPGLVNTTIFFSQADFINTYQDQDGDPLVLITILSLPLNGTLLLNGNPVTPNQDILANELDNLSLVPDPGFTGNISFQWNGFDGTAYAAEFALATVIIPYDSDGDGIPDAIELGDPNQPRDTDNDGTPDYLDTDSDGDGIPDEVEAGEDPENPVDTDGDGMPDYMDLDSDGDGKSDESEGLDDCDGDGIANYIDDQDDCIDELIFYGGISPNGDGHNDLWEIDGIWQYPNNTVQIYNRWGNLVFRSSGYDNLNEAWYGQSNEGLRVGDQELPDGTYFYVVDLGDGSKARSGYIILKR